MGDYTSWWMCATVYSALRSNTTEGKVSVSRDRNLESVQIIRPAWAKLARSSAGIEATPSSRESVYDRLDRR